MGILDRIKKEASRFESSARKEAKRGVLGEIGRIGEDAKRGAQRTVAQIARTTRQTAAQIQRTGAGAKSVYDEIGRIAEDVGHTAKSVYDEIGRVSEDIGKGADSIYHEIGREAEDLGDYLEDKFGPEEPIDESGADDLLPDEPLDPDEPDLETEAAGGAADKEVRARSRARKRAGLGALGVSGTEALFVGGRALGAVSGTSSLTGR